MSDLETRQLESYLDEALDYLRDIRLSIIIDSCHYIGDQCIEHRQIKPCVIEYVDKLLQKFPEN